MLSGCVLLRLRKVSNKSCKKNTHVMFNKFVYGVGPVTQSVQRLTTAWTVRDLIPVGTRFFARPNRPWGPPRLLYNGYRVFPGGKLRPGYAADHSPPSSAAVMEEQSYTSTHPLGHTGPVTGSLYLLLIQHVNGFEEWSSFGLIPVIKNLF